MRGVLGSWLIALLALTLAGQVAAPAAPAQEANFLLGRKATWRYSAGGPRPPDDWTRPSFDDAAWKSGRAGFGYGDSDDETVLGDMQGRYAAAYLRGRFEVERPGDVESLHLYVNYDDGFVAYLNGKEVASASMVRVAGGLRVDQHEAEGYEEFAIRDAKALLRPGRNVLAIEGHNATADSSDFTLDPVLAIRASGPYSVADYLADVDELERRLLDQSSYLTRLGFDGPGAIAALRRSIDAGTRPERFARDVEKLVMRIGDCHAAVWPGTATPGRGFLPIRPADTGSGIAALGIDRDGPLDPGCPYLESIDGEPLGRWLDAAAGFVARGSPQFVRRRSIERLGDLGPIREELGLPPSEVVVIGLRSEDGLEHATRRLRPANQRYGIARVRPGPTRLLGGDIGYLRIPEMDDRLVEPSVAAIRSFRGTKGLIIDVRDNEGGTYGVMRGIYGFFVPDDAGPRVTNIAAYRLAADFAPDHIEYRPTHRADWAGWDDRERLAIRRAAAAFRPEWTPPPGKFSDWHYMLLGRDRSGRGAPAGGDYFAYDRPVVVLSNAGSFSATDGFLNAFADLPGVTIVGEPSGGGSGSTRRFRLPATRLNVALSSMASFRPDGRLFDGRGIEVDVAARPKLEDYTTDADSVLERAIGLIRAKAR